MIINLRIFVEEGGEIMAGKAKKKAKTKPKKDMNPVVSGKKKKK